MPKQSFTLTTCESLTLAEMLELVVKESQLIKTDLCLLSIYNLANKHEEINWDYQRSELFFASNLLEGEDKPLPGQWETKEKWKTPLAIFPNLEQLKVEGEIGINNLDLTANKQLKTLRLTETNCLRVNIEGLTLQKAIMDKSFIPQIEDGWINYTKQDFAWYSIYTFSKSPEKANKTETEFNLLDYWKEALLITALALGIYYYTTKRN